MAGQMPLDGDVTLVDLNKESFRRNGTYDSVTKEQVKDLFCYNNIAVVTKTAEGKVKLVTPDDDEKNKNFLLTPGKTYFVIGVTSDESRKNMLFNTDCQQAIQERSEHILNKTTLLKKMKSYLQMKMTVLSLRNFANDPTIKDEEIQYLEGFRRCSPFTIKVAVDELAIDFDDCISASRRTHSFTIRLAEFMVKFFTEWNSYANSAPKMSLDCGQLIELLQNSHNQNESLKLTFDAAIKKSRNVTATLRGAKENYAKKIETNNFSIHQEEADKKSIDQMRDDLKKSADTKKEEFNAAKLTKEDLEKKLNGTINKLWVICHDHFQKLRMAFFTNLKLRLLQTENDNRREMAEDNVTNKKIEVEEATKKANEMVKLTKHKLEEIEMEIKKLKLIDGGYKAVKERVEQLHNLVYILNDQCTDYGSYIRSFMDVFTDLKLCLDSFIQYNGNSIITIPEICPRVLEIIGVSLTLKAIAELHEELTDRFDTPSIDERKFSNSDDLKKEIEKTFVDAEKFITLKLSAAKENTKNRIARFARPYLKPSTSPNNFANYSDMVNP